MKKGDITLAEVEAFLQEEEQTAPTGENLEGHKAISSALARFQEGDRTPALDYLKQEIERARETVATRLDSRQDIQQTLQRLVHLKGLHSVLY